MGGWFDELIILEFLVQGGIPGSLLPPGAGSGSPGPPWPLQVLPQGGGGGGNRGYGEGQVCYQ